MVPKSNIVGWCWTHLNTPASNTIQHWSNTVQHHPTMLDNVWPPCLIRLNWLLKIKTIIRHSLCSCGDEYAGETMRNLKVRIVEHNNIKQKSEPARHLQKNRDYVFDWKILFTARNIFKRKIVEGLFLQKLSPYLNKQVKILKRNTMYKEWDMTQILA